MVVINFLHGNFLHYVTKRNRPVSSVAVVPQGMVREKDYGPKRRSAPEGLFSMPRKLFCGVFCTGGDDHG